VCLCVGVGGDVLDPATVLLIMAIWYYYGGDDVGDHISDRNENIADDNQHRDLDADECNYCGSSLWGKGHSGSNSQHHK